MQTFLLVSQDKQAENNFVKNFKQEKKVSDVNFHDIKAKNSLGIEEIRKIKKILTYKPVGDRVRLLVLRDFHKATIEAQNSLLKILEEPPAGNFIILTTPQIEIIIETIISRCQIIKIKTENNQMKNQKSITMLNQILNTTTDKRILIAQELAKSKEDCLNILEDFIKILHDELINGNNFNLNRQNVGKLLSKIISAKKLIEANVNLKATLDILLIGFPNG